MGNAALAAELSTAMDSFDVATTSLQNATHSFISIVNKIEARYRQLEQEGNILRESEERVDSKLALIKEKEQKLRDDEARIKELIKELDNKKGAWEKAEKRMVANANKRKQQIRFNVGMISLVYSSVALL